MNIKEQNSSLYYYLLDCKNEIIMGPNNKFVEELIFKRIEELDKDTLLKIMEIATEIRKDQLANIV